MESHKQRKFVVDWDSTLKKKPDNEGFTHFISTFMATGYKIINGDSPPRSLPQHKRILQLNKDTTMGDWYLFEDYTEIRVYGSKLPPYQLPIFMPMRIFALEFITQSLNTYQIHFVQAKKSLMFKLPMTVGPSIVNCR